MKSYLKLNPSACALGSFLLLSTTEALANTAGTGMPWETPLQTIETSITGPTAVGLGIICLAIGGITAAVGDELSGIVRKLINIVVAVGIGVSASPLITKLFGVSGALF
jgi:type IV secretory pathway VirB2 component (pilin)